MRVIGVAIPAGLPGVSVGPGYSLYNRACNWIVQLSQKNIFACYRSRWDRFWASGACQTWATITTPTPATILETVTEFATGSGAPLATLP